MTADASKPRCFQAITRVVAMVGLLGLLGICGVVEVGYLVAGRPHQSQFDLWVRVVDQDGKPVAGYALSLPMQYFPWYPSVLPKSKSRVMVTDSDGFVHYDSGYSKGFLVHISPVQHDSRNTGFLPPNVPEWDKLAVSAGQGPVTKLDQEHCRVLTVFRQGEPVPLIKYDNMDHEICVDPCQSRCISIDVLSGKVEAKDDPKASLHLILECSDNTEGISGVKRLGSVEIIASHGGGVQKAHDLFWVEAPEAPSSGYESTCRLTPQDLVSFNHVYFVLMRGQVYGHLLVDRLYGPNQQVRFYIAFKANPRGSRNLYSAPGLTIPFPVTLPFREQPTGR